MKNYDPAGNIAYKNTPYPKGVKRESKMTEEKDLNRKMAEMMKWKLIRHVDNNEPVFYFKPDADTVGFEDWDPLHDIKQAMNCAEKVRLFQNHHLWQGEGGEYFITPVNFDKKGQHDFNPATAIVKAIAEAIKY